MFNRHNNTSLCARWHRFDFFVISSIFFRHIIRSVYTTTKCQTKYLLNRIGFQDDLRIVHQFYSNFWPYFFSRIYVLAFSMKRSATNRPNLNRKHTNIMSVDAMQIYCMHLLACKLLSQ